MAACIYILRFDKSGRYYIGSTDNLDRRLIQHHRGNTPSTKHLGDFQVVFSQEVPSLEIARKAEKKLKSWKRRDYIERIIEDGRIRFLLSDEAG